LRAGESYSGSRYGIDAVPMWPRLIHVIPDSYFVKVDQSNNHLAFLINCSLLSLFLALLCCVGSLYQYIILKCATIGQTFPIYFIKADPKLVSIYQQRIVLYLVCSIMSFLWSWLFYRATLPIAEQYGNMIRSAYDLFRFNLLEQLKLHLPLDSEEEYQLWQKVSEFITIGPDGRPLIFYYNVEENQAEVMS
jgi:hypothetical protein